MAPHPPECRVPNQTVALHACSITDIANAMQGNPDGSLQRTLIIYESEKGQLVDNALLVSKASLATFPDGSTGGATGVSYVEARLLPIGAILADLTATTASGLDAAPLVNGLALGLSPDETIKIGDEATFGDAPPFSIDPDANSVVKYVYYATKPVS